jgi:hypothetical protein
LRWPGRSHGKESATSGHSNRGNAPSAHDFENGVNWHGAPGVARLCSDMSQTTAPPPGPASRSLSIRITPTTARSGRLSIGGRAPYRL